MPAAKSEKPYVDRVLRMRVRDKHADFLLNLAYWVNFVWNYINALSYQVLMREGRFLSKYELDEFTAGATKEGLPLHSQTIQAIDAEFATRRRQAKRAKLRWRVSDPRRANYSLGWIPFKKSALRYRNGQVFFMGHPIGLWDSYGLGAYELGPGCFAEDSRGRWYLNIVVRVARAPRAQGRSDLGLDLGLKDFAATSTGETIEAQRIYRELEPTLARAQRAGKTDRVRAIHAKIRNRRRDFLHKLSTRLVHSHGAIFVGNVNASALAKTDKAKSVLDAGWSAFRTMLRYKCDDAGVWFDEIDESFSTQTCSVCLARCGPKGIAGLGIREWQCEACGAVHNRDVNAACNILAAGRRRLAEGISVL